MSISYSELTFRCEFTSPAVLPAYKGSAIRGVFGYALKKVVCALKFQECYSCILQRSCLYFQMFESPSNSSSNHSSMDSHSFHPYHFDLLLDDKSDYAVGDILEFSLVLYGDKVKSFSYFILAIFDIGKMGLGKAVNGKRGTFVVNSILSDGIEIYDKENNLLNPLSERSFDLSSIEVVKSDCVQIQFITPFRVKSNNTLAKVLTFDLLMRTILRRYVQIYKYCSGLEPELHYAELLDKAHKVLVSDSSLKWRDWNRYSSRQDAVMTFGGLLGEAQFEGDMTPFLPYLKFGELFHIGKQTTFGLGKFKVLNAQ